jgi:outer membrane protein assembly factor BamA
LEYRIPLFKIEKAVMPAVSLDRVYLNAFIDLGRLWDKYYTEQTAYSVGGEMVLRLAFGAAAAFDLSCGAAYGIAPEHYWRIYLRTGRSF